jgi:hypothetical protein
MPFLIPFIPAIVGGIASIGAGAAASALASSGGQKGSGFTAQAANLQTPTTTGEAQVAQDQAQSGIAQQQNLANSLQAQNGIGNQSNVYNQEQGIAAGTGPNPAQAMLNQATSANTAATTSALAGQRGAGANIGLEGRQAGMIGGQNQQAAAGQGATLQANQSLAALGQAGNIAGQQVNNQMGAVQGLNSDVQNNQGQVLGAINAQNQANISNVSQQNTANEAIAAGNAKTQNAAIGGAASGLGAMASGMTNTALKPSGTTSTSGSGTVTPPNTAGGVPTQPTGVAAPAGGAYGGMVENKKLAQVPTGDRFPASDLRPHQGYGNGGFGGGGYATGGSILPSHLSDIANIYHTGQFQSLAYGGMAGGGLMRHGGHVPGQAKVSGDSPVNDTVKTRLSPGEAVIPKSVMESADPASGAAQFVAALGKQDKHLPPENDFKKALAGAIKNRKKK